MPVSENVDSAIATAISSGFQLIFIAIYQIIIAFFTFVGLYIGAVYLDNDCSENLALFMLIMGIVHFIIFIINIWRIIKIGSCTICIMPTDILIGKNINPFRTCYTLVNCFECIPGCILSCFSLAWLIIGTVWLVESSPDDTNCPNVLYEWTYGYIVVYWTIGILIFLYAIFIFVFVFITTLSINVISTALKKEDDNV